MRWHKWVVLIAGARMVLVGALDELKKLRILIAHVGGYVPYQIGRMECAFRNRASTRVNTQTSPRELMRRFYFDALTHDPHSLRLPIDQVGADHIAIGTDNPFDMGYQDPLGELDKVPNLTTHERDCVCCQTAQSLLGEAQFAYSGHRQGLPLATNAPQQTASLFDHLIRRSCENLRSSSHSSLPVKIRLPCILRRKTIS